MRVCWKYRILAAEAGGDCGCGGCCSSINRAFVVFVVVMRLVYTAVICRRVTLTVTCCRVTLTVLGYVLSTITMLRNWLLRCTHTNVDLTCAVRFLQARSRA